MIEQLMSIKPGTSHNLTVRQTYLMHEYRALRDEIIEYIKQIAAMHKFLFISCAVTVAWLLNEAGNINYMASSFGAWVPFF